MTSSVHDFRAATSRMLKNISPKSLFFKSQLILNKKNHNVVQNET